MSTVDRLPLALRLPLTGTQLVEASAGTGKTHTLVLLLLRAIIIDRRQPRELVAVTYTRAAAGELRERTRAALAAAARRALDPEAAVDGTLAATLDLLIDQALGAGFERRGRPGLATRLRAAELDIDALWLTTMHGFCQRLLLEFGPLLGVVGGVGEVDPGDDLMALACADCWRELQGRGQDCGLLGGLWPGPDALTETLKVILPLAPDALVPPAPAPASLQQAAVAYQAAWRGVLGCVDGYDDYAAELADRDRYGVSRDKAHGLPDALLAELGGQLRAFLQAPPGSVAVPATLARLRTGEVRRLQNKSKINKGVEPPVHALGEALETLVAAERHWCDLARLDVLHALHAGVRQRMAQWGFEQGRVRYDALISETAALLAGPGAKRLVALARARWQLVLIDEFQDTDATQHGIFATLFGDRLVLVGDPKQAIYRFRGGDVHAYRRAAANADGHARLTECYRSEPSVLAAVNALFDPERVASPFREDFIDYHPVASAYDASQRGLLEREGGVRAGGLRLWTVQPPDAAVWGNKTAARAQVVREVGAVIADLLDPASGWQVAGRPSPPLTARDIAVLCSTHKECAAVAGELRRRLIAVTLGADPQVEAAAAEDLRRLLAAWLAPHDAGRLRALALSGFHGLTLAQLPAGRADSPLPAAALAAFSDQARLAQTGQSGRALLQAARSGAAAARTQADGEARIEAWLRLIDLLASWAGPGIGLNQLYLRFRRWQTAQGRPGEALARPPAAAEAVAVMTIHASKGLEFGCVFVPFLWNQKEPGYDLGRMAVPVLRFHDPEGRLRAHLGGSDWAAHVALAKHEELAEAMRSAYVAVTRARHSLFLPVAVSGKAWPLSPLAHLLPGVDAGNGDGLAAALAELAQAAPGGIRIAGTPADPPRAGWATQVGTPQVAVVAHAHLPAPDGFRLLSYSRLVRGLAEQPQDHDQALSEVAVEAAVDAAAPPAPASWRPRGSAFGSCFHALMEAIDPVAVDAEAIARIAAAFGFASDRERAYLASLLQDTWSSPLPGGVALAGLAAADRAVELEFFLPVTGFSAVELGRVLDGHERYRRPPGHWSALMSAARGYLRGFIDLVYRADGQYLVLDYKTNDLGERAANYDDAALAAAIRAHDYDLQYLIYLVALQRMLRQRLGPAYGYERHVGGAVYLFVRGLADQAGRYHDRPPAALVDALERVFCGAAP